MKKNTIEIMHEQLDARNALDSGARGKAFEIAIRSYLAQRYVSKVKPAGKKDGWTTYNGKKVDYEIKTACGEIETADRSKLIIYCPEVDIDFEAELQGYVFTREEWRAFVNGYTGRGSFIRVDKKRGHDHIQSFRSEGRPKASQPIRDYIDAVCFDQPVVADVWER